jgi:CheY-like chemotaxis protein
MLGYDSQIAWRRSNPHEAGAFIVRVGARHMEEPVTVLFVEDDDGVRESVAELLAARGFRMLVAQDAGEALRLLAENRVDALFTDIAMPGIDGVDLARQARRLHPEIEVLFMTGYSARARRP